MKAFLIGMHTEGTFEAKCQGVVTLVLIFAESPHLRDSCYTIYV